MLRIVYLFLLPIMLISCGSRKNSSVAEAQPEALVPSVVFNADSAYSYVARQVEFGPRVPNTEAHAKAAAWLEQELRRHGAEVTLQKADLKAFDGTLLKAVNIIGSYNPDANDRLLLLAHWDSRPWADEDPDASKHTQAVDGANDGASGVGVLLEVARQLGANKPERGIDILFVDAEDWGTDDIEDSWALGARYFAENPFKPGYLPSEAILLDMVGGKGAVFPREYFSQQQAGHLVNKIWALAAASGFSERFPDRIGGAITDDHIQLLNRGIPAIDIIEQCENSESAFNPTWHTTSDNMSAIDASTLGIVGQLVLNYIFPPRDK